MSLSPNINLMVVDLSHYDTVTDWNAVKNAGVSGVIYKATQGDGYCDSTYIDAKAKATAIGLLWGSYHFIDDSDPVDQVKNYLEYADPGDDELIALDYESNDSNTASLSQAKEFIQSVEEQLSRPNECILYSGSQIKEALGDKADSFWSGHRLWLAQYSSDPVVPAAWATQGYWLWQFSGDGEGPAPHTVKGISGNVDCNSFDGTAEELSAQWATGQAVTPPAPAPIPPLAATVILTIETPPGVRVKVIRHSSEAPQLTTG